MKSARPITVLLVEDHVVVRQGLCALLEMDGRFVIAGEARNGREAVELARRLRPDVILMDIAMPMLNGAEATRQILAARPTSRIVVLSAHSDDIYVDRMVQIGVAGFLEKQTSSEILARAIREVAAGRTFFSPAIARRLGSLQNSPRNGSGKRNAKARGLTPRELEVLQLVAEGSANKQIAAALRISIKTVEKHRQHLMNKLEIHDTASLTRYAITAGIIEGNVRLILT
jgi:DNA-binding NarL/FixJ family response regulator